MIPKPTRRLREVLRAAPGARPLESADAGATARARGAGRCGPGHGRRVVVREIGCGRAGHRARHRHDRRLDGRHRLVAVAARAEWPPNHEQSARACCVAAVQVAPLPAPAEPVSPPESKSDEPSVKLNPCAVAAVAFGLIGRNAFG